jgi:hypothetical protein
MKRKFLNLIAGGVLGLALGFGWWSPARAQDDPLPSWNATPIKQAIVEFVGRVTKAGRPDFVAPAERIATFDNDGTLWVEQPMYVQLAFALDRVKALAPLHPEWARTEPYQSVLEGDTKALAKFWRARSRSIDHGDPRWHDHRRILENRNGLAGHRARSALQAAPY